MTRGFQLTHVHLLLTLFLCAFLGFLTVKYEVLSQTVDENPLSSAVETLTTEQTELRSILDSISRARYVPEARHQSDMDALADQVKGLKPDEQLGTELQSLRADLTLMNAVLSGLSIELANLKTLSERRAVAPSIKAATKPKPRAVIAKLPFEPLAIEQRGGETLLSISTAGNQRLGNLQLLRLGDTHSGWRLQSLKGDQAEFLSPQGSRQSFVVR